MYKDIDSFKKKGSHNIDNKAHLILAVYTAPSPTQSTQKILKELLELLKSMASHQETY